MAQTLQNVAYGDDEEAQASAAPDVALKKRLHRSRRAGSARALILVAPLLVFLLVTFLLPIGLLLLRAVDNREVPSVLATSAPLLAAWDRQALPSDQTFSALVDDLKAAPRDRIAEVGKRLNYLDAGFRTLLTRTVRDLGNVDPAKAKESLIAINEKWGEPQTWQTIVDGSPALTSYYLLKAVDLKKGPDGSITAASDDAIYVDVILRTVFISFSVTVLCVLIGYPLAYMLASTDDKTARWLMMLVLLPFWTSLLVRTTAWLVLLQSNGVVNSILKYVGVIAEPIELVHNRIGVLVAMTHILLPFVVLPVHAVMKGIPSTYWRAASSLGAPPYKAFLRVYLPLTLPGVGAGALLVFILALGYYITPALVGGPKDQMLSYFIAYFVNQSSNWGMAAALAVVLLALVVGFYSALVIAYGHRSGARA
ncbi:ABC transporter permease subunit [Rhizobium leguminosarum]|uniref:ABC transporter permease n=1 Tax=Rhizobium leguminosarum TaxID=384 RepID=UPI0013DAF9FB|nr:ABC transporter permease [Rhizobium leguminosarum]NEH48318.1 ABC transporter permease subunit [Rhizobium leguminosarum]